jgi:hypothetical protein
MGSKSIEEDGIGEEMGEVVGALLIFIYIYIYIYIYISLESTNDMAKISLTKSLKKVQDG